MKYSLFLAAASAAVASAQVVYDDATGVWKCSPYAPNANYCAGDSLKSNIIIRCTNGIGQPGNCNDNLAGAPPFGVNYSPCYETAPLAGDALCSKNCIVYPEHGEESFTVPGCTPTETSTTTYPVYTPPVYSTGYPPVHPTGHPPVYPPVYPPVHNTTTIEYTTITVTEPCTTEGTTSTSTYTTVVCHKCQDTTTTYIKPPYPSGTGVYNPSGTGIPPPPSNGTTVITPGTPTRTPVGPTGTQPPPFTGGASMKSAGGLLAGVGLLAAYFL